MIATAISPIRRQAGIGCPNCGGTCHLKGMNGLGDITLQFPFLTDSGTQQVDPAPASASSNWGLSEWVLIGALAYLTLNVFGSLRNLGRQARKRYRRRAALSRRKDALKQELASLA